jgi:ligand-binding SRPBCC domain-containing protein
MSGSTERASFAVDVGLGLEEAFDFFSAVGNLNRVTPRWFHLEPTDTPPERLFEGATIDYRFRWRSMRMRWRTRVTLWEPPRLFTYEQELGPYRFFRHEHRFEPAGLCTRVRDVVWFRAPGGRAVARWIVRPELERIFAYRAGVARELFPPGKSTLIDYAKSAMEEPA